MGVNRLVGELQSVNLFCSHHEAEDSVLFFLNAENVTFVKMGMQVKQKRP